jgi:hypothetical protein
VSSEVAGGSALDPVSSEVAGVSSWISMPMEFCV